MSRKTTYLDGRLTISSMTTPTDEEITAIQALSETDYEAFMTEVLDEGRNSPLSDKSLDDVWADALKEYRAKQKTTVDAL